MVMHLADVGFEKWKLPSLIRHYYVSAAFSEAFVLCGCRLVNSSSSIAVFVPYL